MALHWKINSEQRLFEVVCDDFVEASEIHEMLDVLVGSKALAYRKLFDASRANTTMAPLDILSIGVRMRSLHVGFVPLGPLAVVIPSDKYMLLSRVLGILAAGRRPMRIFSDAKIARNWLVSQHCERGAKSELPRPKLR